MSVKDYQERRDIQVEERERYIERLARQRLDWRSER